MTQPPSGRYQATHRAVRAPRRRPSGRALAVAAVGGVLLTGGAVTAQAVVGGSADQAEASAGEPALSSGSTVSRSAVRPDLESVQETSKIATDKGIAADKKAAAKAKAEKKAQEKADAEAREKAAKKKAIDNAKDDPQGAAKALLADYGWDAAQFSCLDALWKGESGWNYQATNPSSGAYGIPQSLPAIKMASAGADWKTNPITQIRWGLGYIEDVYGTPCEAQGFKSGRGWY